MAVKIANIEVSNESPLLLIAGTCVIESEALAQDVAGHIKEITENLGIPYVFKSSFDKANRTSIESYRGPGIEEGLRILQSVKEKIGVPVLTDVHEEHHWMKFHQLLTSFKHLLFCVGKRILF
ncbi:MAG: hypothetical protein Ct9H300mP6_05230 [Gammaproteobacteria bacterium]|nr:MAG: hypothetical protein Ct9H300mP6_05230 [Gammaproteobacteria bacterium]